MEVELREVPMQSHSKRRTLTIDLGANKPMTLRLIRRDTGRPASPTIGFFISEILFFFVSVFCLLSQLQFEIAIFIRFLY